MLNNENQGQEGEYQHVHSISQRVSGAQGKPTLACLLRVCINGAPGIPALVFMTYVYEPSSRKTNISVLIVSSAPVKLTLAYLLHVYMKAASGKPTLA